jgi:hypothetical protein
MNTVDVIVLAVLVINVIDHLRWRSECRAARIERAERDQARADALENNVITALWEIQDSLGQPRTKFTRKSKPLDIAAMDVPPPPGA